MSKLFEKISQITEGLNEEENKLFSECRYPYILTKADLYLRIGPERYRKQDFFGMPGDDWVDAELEILAEGCRQVMEGKGFSEDKPFVNLGIHGFNLLFMLFHFKPCGRSSRHLGEGRFLDKIQMKHTVDGQEVTYYNLVEHTISFPH